MRRVQWVLLAAVAAHALGWLLPVVDDYRGWQAFRVAFSPIWPFERFHIQPGPLLILSVASAVTNVLFPALVGALLLTDRARQVLWAAAAATLLNLHWPVSMGAQRAELELGYFIWVCSFALLALAAFFAAVPGRR